MLNFPLERRRYVKNKVFIGLVLENKNIKKLGAAQNVCAVL